MNYPSPAPTTRQVSVSEASRELNVSPETVRRWIKSGRLSAERAIRPQGAVWLVALPVTPPGDVAPVIPVTTPHEDADQEQEHAPLDGALHPSPPVTPGAGDASGPMDPSPRPTTEVAALAATVREQAETITRLTRMLEQVMVDMDVLRAVQANWEPILTDETGQATPEPAPDPFLEPSPSAPNDAPWSARWQGRLAVASTLLLALLAASGWLRT
jgi:excisionase family DNA binding protein